MYSFGGRNCSECPLSKVNDIDCSGGDYGQLKVDSHKGLKNSEMLIIELCVKSQS